MSGIDSLQFQQPSRFWWLLGALLVLAGFLWLRKLSAPKVAKRLTTLDLLEDAEREAGNRWRRWLPVAFLVLVLAALFAQWAEPVATAQMRRPDRIILALDNSQSTSAIEQEDGTTRLERIKAEAIGAVESARTGDEIAIVGFADEALLSLPPTADKARLISVIQFLEPEVETDLGGALLEAHSLAKGAPYSSHVIVLSDGAATTDTSVEMALERLAQDEIAVSTVLIGTTGGYILEDSLRRPFPAKPAVMERIAKQTGGVFHTETSDEPLLSAAYELMDRSERSFEVMTRAVEWFIPLTLILAVLAGIAHHKVYRTPWAH